MRSTIEHLLKSTSEFTVKPQERYALAQAAVIQIQKDRFEPPPRKEINKMVFRIIKQFDLDKKNENYFRLWAICSLLGKEAMTSFWKKKKSDYRSRASRDVKRLKHRRD